MCSQSDDPTQYNYEDLINTQSYEECEQEMYTKYGRHCANPAEHLYQNKAERMKYTFKSYPPIANNEELDPYNTMSAEDKEWLEASIRDWREQIEEY